MADGALSGAVRGTSTLALSAHTRAARFDQHAHNKLLQEHPLSKKNFLGEFRNQQTMAYIILKSW